MTQSTLSDTTRGTAADPSRVADVAGTAAGKAPRPPLRVGLAGFGAVGQDLARRLLRGDLPGAHLTAVCANRLDAARERLDALDEVDGAGAGVPVMSLDALLHEVDIVCECATAESFPDIARAVMRAGKTMITVSVAGLPNTPDLLELATQHGGRIRVASGGLPGLDAVRAVKEDGIERIRLKTTFRPESLAHEPFVLGLGFDFNSVPAASIPTTKVFAGTAREAAAAFPRHFNVAIALSLCGVGFDKTDIEVWVDGAVEGAVQEIEVKAYAADLTLISRNRPSRNPRTSRIVAPSMMAALRNFVDVLQVGS
jgi:aspartate dehydrogenase